MRPLRPLPALLLLLVAAAGPAAHAQSEGLLQVEDELHRYLDRQQTLGHLPDAALGAKPLSAYEARAFLDSLALRSDALTRLDRRRLAQYRGEQVGGLLRGVTRTAPWLYRNGTTALSVEDAEFGLEAEPLAAFALGPVVLSGSDGEGGEPGTPPGGARDSTAAGWQNTRGLRVAGHLDAGAGFGLLFFETRLEENQVRLPRPAAAVGTAPRLGFVAIPEDGVYDYFVATGVVGYHTRRFEARFGRDRNRWGYGRESLVVSNYATVYDQLQLRWRVWRIEFTNLYARFTQPERGSGAILLPDHYGAFHRLALNVGKGLEFEAFESIIFAPDSTGRSGFELAYLNPFQFYRGTERELGSADNALLGVGAAWTSPWRTRFYAQGLLDELKVSEFFDDWWGNKWAYLVGAHVVDPGTPSMGYIHGLDLRVEYARLRPYLYTHRAACRDLSACPPYIEQTAPAAYVHYGDILGHPAGPNASDLTVSVHYRPVPDFLAAVDVVYTRAGRDSETVYYGRDPNVPYDARPREFDDQVETLQGIRQNRLLVESQFEARLLPGLFAGAGLRIERIDDAETGTDKYYWPLFSLRWGLPAPSLRF